MTPFLLIAGWWLVLLAYGCHETPERESVLEPEVNVCEGCGIAIDGPWLLCQWCDDWTEE